jgi:hypothetical protein
LISCCSSRPRCTHHHHHRHHYGNCSSLSSMARIVQNRKRSAAKSSTTSSTTSSSSTSSLRGGDLPLKELATNSMTTTTVWIRFVSILASSAAFLYCFRLRNVCVYEFFGFIFSLLTCLLLLLLLLLFGLCWQYFSDTIKTQTNRESKRCIVSGTPNKSCANT